MSRVPSEITELFFSGQRASETPYVVNDTVEILGGPHAGRYGAAISIESVKPLTILVEFGDDGKAEVIDATLLRLLP
jgi:hypothetical protein